MLKLLLVCKLKTNAFWKLNIGIPSSEKALSSTHFVFVFMVEKFHFIEHFFINWMNRVMKSWYLELHVFCSLCLLKEEKQFTDWVQNTFQQFLMILLFNKSSIL